MARVIDNSDYVEKLRRYYVPALFEAEKAGNALLREMLSAALSRLLQRALTFDDLRNLLTASVQCDREKRLEVLGRLGVVKSDIDRFRDKQTRYWAAYERDLSHVGRAACRPWNQHNEKIRRDRYLEPFLNRTHELLKVLLDDVGADENDRTVVPRAHEAFREAYVGQHLRALPSTYTTNQQPKFITARALAPILYALCPRAFACVNEYVEGGVKQLTGAFGKRFEEYLEVILPKLADAAREAGLPDHFGALDQTIGRIDNQGIGDTTWRFPEEISEPERCPEGAKASVVVNAYERSGKARRNCIKHHGTTCSVCSFDFEKVYGEIGSEYIHVHHQVPLSEIGHEYEVDPVNDLLPVCPNCHAMIHCRKWSGTPDELRTVMSPNYLALLKSMSGQR